jgi:uncharacterized membrane protein YqjE
MSEPDEKDGGWLGSLRRVGNSVLALIHTRVELFSVELQEEKLRALNLVIWFVVALTLGVAGLLIAMTVLGVFLWERTGYVGVICLAVITLGSSAALLWFLRRQILRGPGPFEGTISELGKDLACLQSRE